VPTYVERSVPGGTRTQVLFAPPPAAADLVLEVQTTELSLDDGPRSVRVEPVNNTRVGLYYEVEVRLGDRRDDHVLAQGTCIARDARIVAARRVGSSTEADQLLAPLPTLEEMLSPNLERLNLELERVRDQCERELRASVLGLAQPPPERPPAVPSSAAAAPMTTRGDDALLR
jgi:hypothetical protein